MLKNARLAVTTYNYIDNLSATKNFDDLEFNCANELTVSFQVPVNLSKIECKLTTEVQNSTTKRMDSFTRNHTFVIENQSSSEQNSMGSAFLRKSSDSNYFISLMGRNGE